MSTKRPPIGRFAMIIRETPTPGRGGSNGDGPGAQFLAKSGQNDNSKFSIPTKRRANGQFRTIMIEKRSRELSASNGDAPGAYSLAKTGQNGPLTPIPRWGGYGMSARLRTKRGLLLSVPPLAAVSVSPQVSVCPRHGPREGVRSPPQAPIAPRGPRARTHAAPRRG